jgi:superfamily I DNA/RNA helicase
MVRSYSLDVPGGQKGDAYFEALAAVVERAVETGRVPGGQYTALLIDEAHDFADAWLRIAARMVNPATNSLLVLYDDAQSIYRSRRRRFSLANVGIEARGRTSILRLNYRNTAEVLALAMQCTRELLDEAAPRGDDEVPLVHPTSAGRRGPLPVLIEARSESDEARMVAERIAADLAAGVAPDQIAVLARARALLAPVAQALAARGTALQSMNSAAYRHFDWHRPSVKLLTMHSAKGLEFERVYVVGLQALPWKDETAEDAVRLLYVAMTRATSALVLSAAAPSALVGRVRGALAELAQRFAAAAGPSA